MIKLAGATVAGRSHEATKMPCQDAVATYMRGNTACIALADGAGSRPMSHLGSALASRRIAVMLVSQFSAFRERAVADPQALAASVVGDLQRTMDHRARRKGLQLEDLACTLLFAACRKGDFVTGHIGDGVVVVRDGVSVVTLSEPENGEYSNTTFFVTDRGAANRLRISTGSARDSISALLMSDGSAESLYDKRTASLGSGGHRLMDWAARLPPRRMRLMLASNLREVIRTKTTDDCALAVLAAGAS